MKKLLMAISLILVAVLLLSSLPLGVLADGETVIEMKATVFPSGAADKTSGTSATAQHITAADDEEPLVSAIPSDRFLFGWNGEIKSSEWYATNTGALIQHIIYFGKIGTSSKFKNIPGLFNLDTDGIMFYVNLTDKGEETKLYTEIQTTKFNENDEGEYEDIYLNGKNTETKHVPMVDSTAAFLPAGTDEWIVDTNDHKLGVGGRKTSSAISIPAGFEGWVYIPNTTLNDKSRTADGHIWAYRVNMYISNLSNDYDIEMSNFMTTSATVDEIVAADGFKANGVTYKYSEHLRFNAEALTVLGAEQSHDGFYTVDSATGALAESYNKADANYTANVGSDVSKEYLMPSKLDVAPYTHSVRYASVGTHITTATAQSVTGRNLFLLDGTGEAVAITSSSGSFFEFNKSISTIGADDSAMFYVERVGGTVPLDVHFMFNWYGIKGGQTYYTYNLNGGAKWESNVAPTNSQINALRSGEGYFELPVGFKGWIVVPYAATGHSGDDLRLRLGAYALGGETYGQLLFGDVSVIDNIDLATNNDALKLSTAVSSNSNSIYSVFPFNTAGTKNAMSGNLRWNSTESNDLAQGTLTRSIDANGKVTISLTGARTARKNSSGQPSFDGNTRTYHNYVVSDIKPALTAGGALMVHVQNETDADYQAIFGENLDFVQPGMPYYLLSDSDNKWEKFTASTSADDSYLISSRTAVPVVIPAGFKGWVSLPLTSLVDTNGGNTKSLNTTLGNINYFTLLTVAAGKGNIYLSNFSASTTVTPVHLISGSGYVGMNANIPEVTEKVTATVKNENGTFTNSNDVVSTTLYVEQNIPVGGGLMFWVETEKAVSFKISVGDMATAKKYGADRAWTAAFDNGYITLPAGFSGFVKVAVPEGSVTDKLRFTFASLSNGFKVSDFMSLNTAADLDTVSLANGREKPIVYKVGDFSLDNNVDILDLVVAKVNENATSLYSFTRFEGEGTQSALLRAFLLK